MPTTPQTADRNGHDADDPNASDPAMGDLYEADDAPGPSVHDHLELALEVARDEGMSTSELMGIFFYYAHSIAASYRQDVLDQAGAADHD